MRELFPSRNLKIVLVATSIVIGSGLLPTITTANAESNWLRVDNVRSGSVLWLRAGPASSFERIGLLPYDARHIRNFGCKEFNNGTWCKIRYRGTKGWASKKYLAPDTRLKT